MMTADETSVQTVAQQNDQVLPPPAENPGEDQWEEFIDSCRRVSPYFTEAKRKRVERLIRNFIQLRLVADDRDWILQRVEESPSWERTFGSRPEVLRKYGCDAVSDNLSELELEDIREWLRYDHLVPGSMSQTSASRIELYRDEDEIVWIADVSWIPGFIGDVTWPNFVDLHQQVLLHRSTPMDSEICVDDESLPCYMRDRDDENNNTGDSGYFEAFDDPGMPFDPDSASVKQFASFVVEAICVSLTS